MVCDRDAPVSHCRLSWSITLLLGALGVVVVESKRLGSVKCECALEVSWPLLAVPEWLRGNEATVGKRVGNARIWGFNDQPLAVGD